MKPCLDKLREEARYAYRDYLHNIHCIAEGKTAPPPLQILIDQMNQGISDEAYEAKLIDYLMLSMLDPTDGVPLKRNSMTALLDLIATGIDTYEQEYLNQTLAEFAGEGLPIYKHIQNIYASMQYMGMFPQQTSYGISYQSPYTIAEWLRRIEFWKNEIRHISSRDLFDTSTFLPTNQEDVESYLEKMLTGFEPYDIKVANGEIHLISYAIIQWGTQIELFNGVEGIADTLTVFQREMNTLKTPIIWAEIGQEANFLTGLQLLTYAALKEVAVRHACAFMDKRAKNRSRLQELKDKIVEKDAYREISQKLSDTIYEFIFENYPKEDGEVFSRI